MGARLKSASIPLNWTPSPPFRVKQNGAQASLSFAVAISFDSAYPETATLTESSAVYRIPSGGGGSGRSLSRLADQYQKWK